MGIGWQRLVLHGCCQWASLEAVAVEEGLVTAEAHMLPFRARSVKAKNPLIATLKNQKTKIFSTPKLA
jgi:hypothetical protein